MYFQKRKKEVNHTKTDLLKNVFFHPWFLVFHFPLSEMKTRLINNFQCNLTGRIHAYTSVYVQIHVFMCNCSVFSKQMITHFHTTVFLSDLFLSGFIHLLFLTATQFSTASIYQHLCSQPSFRDLMVVSNFAITNSVTANAFLHLSVHTCASIPMGQSPEGRCRVPGYVHLKL